VILRNAFVGNFDNINQHETKEPDIQRNSRVKEKKIHLLMQLESVQNDEEFTKTIIKNVIVLPI